jgi:hypothetical protein
VHGKSVSLCEECSNFGSIRAHFQVSEVVANRGLEMMGHAKGEYKFLHPNDDVNYVRIDQRHLSNRRKAGDRNGSQRRSAEHGTTQGDFSGD